MGNIDDEISTALPSDDNDSDNEGKKSGRTKKLVRVGISVLLIWVIYLAVDFKRLGRTLAQLSWGSVLLLLLLYTIGQVLSALKWRIFLQRVGMIRPVGETVRAYLFGMFVNSIGLGIGTVGGDIARALALQPPRGQRAGALATVLADRLHGLVVLLGIGAVALFVQQPEPLSPLVHWITFGSLIGLVFAWFIGPQIVSLLVSEENPKRDMIESVLSAFPNAPRPLFLASALSLGVHTLQIAMHVVIAHELKAPIPTEYLFATVPLVNVASSLPISINGVGVREGMYIWLLSPFISREMAVAFGAVWVVTVTVSGILGGLFLTPEMRAAASRAVTSNRKKNYQKVVPIEQIRTDRNRKSKVG